MSVCNNNDLSETYLELLCQLVTYMDGLNLQYKSCIAYSDALTSAPSTRVNTEHTSRRLVMFTSLTIPRCMISFLDLHPV